MDCLCSAGQGQAVLSPLWYILAPDVSAACHSSSPGPENRALGLSCCPDKCLSYSLCFPTHSVCVLPPDRLCCSSPSNCRCLSTWRQASVPMACIEKVSQALTLNRTGPATSRSCLSSTSVLAEKPHFGSWNIWSVPAFRPSSVPQPQCKAAGTEVRPALQVALGPVC